MNGVETLACMPDQIHWFSQAILDYYLSGRITTGEFLRWFHMPNSSYLPAGECIVAQLDPDHDPLQFDPGILEGYVRQFFLASAQFVSAIAPAYCVACMAPASPASLTRTRRRLIIRAARRP